MKHICNSILTLSAAGIRRAPTTRRPLSRPPARPSSRLTHQGTRQLGLQNQANQPRPATAIATQVALPLTMTAGPPIALYAMTVQETRKV